MKKVIWFKLRLVMGLIFLWAFFDKLLGLGFATTKEAAWLYGGSPTYGFFQGLAGMAVVDWLFMLGLLFVGLTLLSNKFIIWGASAGSLMLLLMYLAVFPPENNPLLDDHIVYILVLGLLVLKSKER